MDEALAPFAGWAGPRNAKIVLVGEAWGQNELALRAPFVGESGKELFRMLGEAMPEVAPELHSEISKMFKYDMAWVKYRGPWLEAAGIALTNVLNLRPPDNKIDNLSVPKKELPPGYPYPAITRGLYLRPEFLPELDRLKAELLECRPNVVVAMGNTACWALLQATNIGSIRGATAESIEMGEARYQVKTLPCYHPAAVLRQWNWRPIVVADLQKAFREAAFPEIRRPVRRALVNPSIEEVRHWATSTLASAPPLLSCDIETGAHQIKMISFAPSAREALLVPFMDVGSPTGSYWPTIIQELEAWHWVRALLESPIPKLGQNFMYDLQYLMAMGIRPRACLEDTMILHHALFQELQKGLGFLGSIYSSEQSWKLMRRKRPDTEKRDE